MFDMLSGQYKNLASKGRYGDTMLAHVNPEEAAMLQSMGGAGTINPKTGLPEFFYHTGNYYAYGMPQATADMLPSLGQALNPEAAQAASQLLTKITVPEERGFGMGGVRPAYEKVNSEFDQYANKQFGGMGVVNVTGYSVPTEQTFAGKPLVAQYDPKGNFQHFAIAGGDVLYPDPNQPNIASSPKINAKGEIVDYGVFDVSQQDDGGFGSFIGGLLEDFGPMILAGIGANLLGPAIAGAAGGGAAALSPYAAQAAGAYGGSAAAAAAAAAGSLTGIQAASAAQNALTAEALARTGITYGGNVTPADIPTTTPTEAPTTTPAEAPVTPPPEAPVTPPPEVPVAPPVLPAADIAASNALAAANISNGLTTDAVTRAAAAAASSFPDLSSLGKAGSAILDFAKANPSIAGSLLGAVTSAIGGANAPKEQTTTSSIDPQIKAEYLANLERAKTTAAGLEARQIAQPGQLYNDAESKLYNLGMTPFGEADIAKFFNPYENQVVQGALGDIERTRLMQEQANRDQATRARAFGGSRQAVVSGMTNEAALRQAANTSAQLRSAGYTQAANLGLQARPMDMTGLQTSLGLGTTRTALEQARLDALRNLGTERLGITSAALGMNIPNLGSSSSQPLYNNTAGNLLSGGLTGAYIGSLLGKA